jgi:hypothetical protein
MMLGIGTESAINSLTLRSDCNAASSFLAVASTRYPPMVGPSLIQHDRKPRTKQLIRAFTCLDRRFARHQVGSL